MKYIHCTNFSAYWCYFTEDNGSLEIHVSGGLIAKAKKYELDDRAQEAIRSVLDASNEFEEDQNWGKASKENIHFDVPLFSLTVVNGDLVLIVNDQS